MPKLSSSRLTFVIVAVAILIAGLAFAVFGAKSPTLSLPGEIQAKEVRNGSRFGGRVKQILVREGQQVRAGQLLVVFDDTDLQVKLAEARAALKQAQAQESLLLKGADAGQVRQARAAVEQTQERLKIVTTGARPEELAQARARVTTAEAQLQQARTTFDNAKVMLDEGIISQQKYESLKNAVQLAQDNRQAAQATLKMLQAGGRPEERAIAQEQLSAARAQYGQMLKGAPAEQVSIASANVEKARSTLMALEAQRDEVRIKAPFSGYVSAIGVSEGELVPPGRPVVSILDYNRLWVDVYVPESRLAMVTLGETVAVRSKSLKNTDFSGRVALINPKREFVPASGGDNGREEASFRVRVDIAPVNGGSQLRLYPGMNADVLFSR